MKLLLMHLCPTAVSKEFGNIHVQQLNRFLGYVHFAGILPKV